MKHCRRCGISFNNNVTVKDKRVGTLSAANKKPVERTQGQVTTEEHIPVDTVGVTGPSGPVPPSNPVSSIVTIMPQPPSNTTVPFGPSSVPFGVPSGSSLSLSITVPKTVFVSLQGDDRNALILSPLKPFQTLSGALRALGVSSGPRNAENVWNIQLEPGVFPLNSPVITQDYISIRGHGASTVLSGSMVCVGNGVHVKDLSIHSGKIQCVSGSSLFENVSIHQCTIDTRLGNTGSVDIKFQQCRFSLDKSYLLEEVSPMNTQIDISHCTIKLNNAGLYRINTSQGVHRVCIRNCLVELSNFTEYLHDFTLHKNLTFIEANVIYQVSNTPTLKLHTKQNMEDQSKVWYLNTVFSCSPFCIIHTPASGGIVLRDPILVGCNI